MRAKRLDGATLATYRALEGRIAASEPEWSIELIPPPAALSAAIPFNDGIPTEAGSAALELIAWASLRLDRGVVLTGPAAEAEAAAEALRADGIAAEVRGGSGPLRAGWAAEAE